MPSDKQPRDPRAEQLAALKRERDEVTASLPKHSVTAAMLVRLEDLDDEIAALEAAHAAGASNAVP